jgi:hypothetical protein
MHYVFFFETQELHDQAMIFDPLKKQDIFFAYFQVDQKYYLFLCSQKPMKVDFFYQAGKLIQ